MTPKDIPNELLDALLANYKKPEDMFGKNGILEQLTKKVVERALEAEMTYHLGHKKHGPVTNSTGNTRNGTSKKTLKGKDGDVSLAVPRDREGSFAPQLVEKHHTNRHPSCNIRDRDPTSSAARSPAIDTNRIWP